MEETVQQKIECTIFLETDRIIQSTITKYWKVSSKERHYYVEDILLEIKALLSCSNHNPSNTDCLGCHYALRKYIQDYKPASSLVINIPVRSRKEKCALK